MMHFYRLRSFRLLALTTLVLFFSGCGINAIPSYDEAAKAAFSQVLNQYKRRSDLIPNLVNVVKGYAAHEKETLEAIIKARSLATNLPASSEAINNPAAMQQFEKNQQQLSGALARLMVVVEQYPTLKANENFLSLQSQLEGTENRIAVARRDYILAVQQYNTELRTFPGRIWAFILYRDAKPMVNFTAPESTQNVPEVHF